jgi:uncharacterized membrane protein
MQPGHSNPFDLLIYIFAGLIVLVVAARILAGVEEEHRKTYILFLSLMMVFSLLAIFI